MIPVFVISKLSSPARWYNAQIELKSLRDEVRPPVRIEAIDDALPWGSLSGPQVGCLCSHLRAMEFFVHDHTSDMALIVEDDVSLEFHNLWSSVGVDSLRQVIDEVPDDKWEVLQLYNGLTRDMMTRLRRRYTPFNSFDGAVAYIIRRAGAERLLKQHTSQAPNLIEPKQVASDFIFNSLCTYTFYYSLFTIVDRFHSEIDPTHVPWQMDTKARTLQRLRQRPEQLDWGFQLYVWDFDDYISNHIRHSKIWEECITSLVAAFSGPNHLFLDVGANIGYYSIGAAVAGSRVISFEPIPENCEMFERSLAIQKPEVRERIHLHKCAVSDRDKTVGMVVGFWNMGGSAVRPHGDVIINATTIDALLSNESGEIDLMKMDIQGHEYLALKGTENLLRARRVRRIIIEISPEFCDATQIFEYLQSFGYQMWLIPEYYEGFSRSLPPLPFLPSASSLPPHQCDVLAIL